MHQFDISYNTYSRYHLLKIRKIVAYQPHGNLVRVAIEQRFELFKILWSFVN